MTSTFTAIGDAADRVIKSTKAKRAKIKSAKGRGKAKAEPTVYDQPAPSHEPVMLSLARINDTDFRLRLPTGARNGSIRCQPGRFIESLGGSERQL